jgi:hypothetical protein
VSFSAGIRPRGGARPGKLGVVDSIVALRARRERYMNASEHDKAWCVCAALVFLRAAAPDEQRFHAQYKPQAVVKAKSKLSADSWAKLVHRDADGAISSALAAGWRAAAATKAVPHKKLGVKRKDRRDLERDPLMLSKLLYYVVQTLDVPLPEVFVVADKKGPVLQIVTAIDKDELLPTLVVRPELLAGKDIPEVTFLLASRAVLMRPEYYPKAVLGSDELASAVAQHVGGRSGDVGRWTNAVDQIGYRAGLLLCGDLEAAARMIAESGIAQAEASTQELLTFAVSEEYFALRAQLGSRIG